MDGVVSKAGSQVDIKREWVCDMSSDEEDLIIRMHKLLGDRWSLIAGRIPGRTAEEIEKYWKFKRHSCENIPRPYHPRVSRIIRRFTMPSRSISERYLKGGLADEFIPKSRT